jgi:hypothetical protein
MAGQRNDGKELYDFAFKTTADMGWVLNMELRPSAFRISA